jgi:hypothetical protein
MKFLAELAPILEKEIIQKNIHKSISTNNPLRLLNSFFGLQSSPLSNQDTFRMSRALSILLFDLISVTMSSINPSEDHGNLNEKMSGKLNRKEEHGLMSSYIVDLIDKSQKVNHDLPIFTSPIFSLQSLFQIILTNYEVAKVIYEFCTSNPFKENQYSEFYSVYLLDEGISFNKKNQDGIVFTPKEIAAFLSENVIDSQTETVIDPAAGSGVLLLETLKILSKNTDFSVNRIIGIEKDIVLALLCESALKYYYRVHSLADISFQIINEDFFECSEILRDVQEHTKKSLSILMNPPYTRQELMLTAHKARYRKKILDSESFNEFLLKYPDFQVSGQSGLYIYFILFISQFLRDGDQVGLIIPNSWMDVKYGSNFQRFLLTHYFIDLLITSQNQKLISSVEVNTVILTLRYRGFRSKQDIRYDPYKIRAITVGDRTDLKGVLKQSNINTNNTTLNYTEQFIEEDDLYSTNKWGMYIRCPRFFRKRLRGINYEMNNLSKYVQIHRGFTSGANDFFYLGKPGTSNRYFHSEFDENNGNLILIPKNSEISSEFTKQSYDLSLQPLRIEKEYWMHPIEKSELVDDKIQHYISQDGQVFVPNYIIKSPKELPRFKVEEKFLNLIVLLIPPVSFSRLKPGILQYISWAETFQPESGKKFNRRRTCASRKYWYSLSVENKRRDLLLCMMTINDRFSFFYNPRNFHIDARLYGIEILDNRVKAEKKLGPFLFLYLNSLFVSIQIELLGRANLGEGGLDVKVYEYLNIKVPTIGKLNLSEYTSLSRFFEQAIIQPSLSLNTTENLPVQKIFNNFILQFELVTSEELAKIDKLLKEIVNNRLDKARS